MDLISGKHLSRLFIQEYQNSFIVHTDDVESLCYIKDEEKRKVVIDSMMSKIKEASALWNLAEGLLQLPAYLNLRVALNEDTLNKAGKNFSQKKGGKGTNNLYEIVPAIEISSNAQTSTIIEVPLPHYEVEENGHWRRLSFDAKGKDQYGNEVTGKTWVKAPSKNKVIEDFSTTIFVKSTLSSARLKISEYIEAAKRSNLTNDKSVSDGTIGELYIMRCSAMQETIFKVGFTQGDSTERARQLSTATGVPFSFVVVKFWKHPNVRALEKDVHMMLEPYRINDAREFFQIKFESIEKIIEATIARLAL
jgi:hypothetical protein